MRLADIEFSTQGTTLVARCSGEIDISNADQLAGFLTDSSSNHLHMLVLDLSAIDYLDSAGIRLTYRLQESLRRRGQALRLVVPEGSPVRHALRLAGLTGHIEMLETVEEALRGVEPLSA
jgi:anti-sigma B factor antagonist